MKRLLSLLLLIMIVPILQTSLSAQLSPLIKFGDSYEEIVRRLDLNDRREMKENFSYMMQVGTSRGTRTKDIFYYDDKIIHLREYFGNKIIIKEAIVYLFKRDQLVLIEVMEPFNELKWKVLKPRAESMYQWLDPISRGQMVIQAPRSPIATYRWFEKWVNRVRHYQGDCNSEWFESTDKCMGVIIHYFKDME